MILDSEALYFHAMKVKVFLVSGKIVWSMIKMINSSFYESNNNFLLIKGKSSNKKRHIDGDLLKKMLNLKKFLSRPGNTSTFL